MISTRTTWFTAWLALSLIAIIGMSAVVVTEASRWRTSATEDETPNQAVAQVEPVNDNAPGAPVQPEVSVRDAVNPDALLVLRGAQLPVAPPPAAPETPVASTPAAPETRIASTSADPEMLVTPAPIIAAPAPIMDVTSRHWPDASATTKMAPTTAQRLKKARDSKAEMRVKRAPNTVANTRTCAPANAFVSWLRKLNLAPYCTT
jgi:hypothetical protein